MLICKWLKISKRSRPTEFYAVNWLGLYGLIVEIANCNCSNSWSATNRQLNSNFVVITWWIWVAHERRFSPLPAQFPLLNPLAPAPLPLHRFLSSPLTAPFPLIRFSARSAPFSAPLTCSEFSSTVRDLLFVNLNGPPLQHFNAEKYAAMWIKDGRHSASFW